MLGLMNVIAMSRMLPRAFLRRNQRARNGSTVTIVDD